MHLRFSEKGLGLLYVQDANFAHIRMQLSQTEDFSATLSRKMFTESLRQHFPPQRRMFAYCEGNAELLAALGESGGSTCAPAQLGGFVLVGNRPWATCLCAFSSSRVWASVLQSMGISRTRWPLRATKRLHQVSTEEY